MIKPFSPAEALAECIQKSNKEWLVDYLTEKINNQLVELMNVNGIETKFSLKTYIQNGEEEGHIDWCVVLTLKRKFEAYGWFVTVGKDIKDDWLITVKRRMI